MPAMNVSGTKIVVTIRALEVFVDVVQFVMEIGPDSRRHGRLHDLEQLHVVGDDAPRLLQVGLVPDQLREQRVGRPGDVLQVEGKVVRVFQIGIRSSIARTRDGEDLVIPNSVRAGRRDVRL